MRNPTGLLPVNATRRVRGSRTSVSPTSPPPPGTKFSTPAGSRTSSISSTNFAAIHAESLGFDHAWLNDHLWTPGRMHRDPAFDAFTGLAAVAAVTDRIALGDWGLWLGLRHTDLHRESVRTDGSTSATGSSASTVRATYSRMVMRLSSATELNSIPMPV